MSRRRMGMILGVVAMLVVAYSLRDGPVGVPNPPRDPVTSDAGDEVDPADVVRAALERERLDSERRSPRRGALTRFTLPGARSDTTVGRASLRGRVVDRARGTGVPNATIQFLHDGATTEVLAEEDGAFDFAPGEDGVYEVALVTADGFVAFAPIFEHSPIRFMARADHAIAGVTLALDRARSLSVHVRDDLDAPVMGATVRELGAMTDGLQPPEEATTSADGVAIVNLRPGSVWEARLLERSGVARVDTSAELAGEIHIVLADSATLGALVGRVLDTDGVAIAGARVDARFEAPLASAEAEAHPTLRGVTDATGAFRLEDADVGSYTLWANADGHGAEQREGVRRGVPVDLSLSGEARIRGRVVDENGGPVPGFGVLVSAILGSVEREGRAARTFYDADGRFEIGGLAPGPYAVTAAASGHAPSVVVEIIARPGSTDAGTLAIRGGATLTGWVRNDDGPIADARVELEGGETIPVRRQAMTDGEGQFVLTGLAEGSTSLLVLAQGHHGRILSGPPAGTPLDIVLTRVAEGERPRLELVGVGAVLAAEGDALVVGQVLHGGGAAEAGLQPGDRVLAVDGVTVGELGFAGAIGRIRGPENSSVLLRVERGDSPPTELEVPRRRIDA